MIELEDFKRLITAKKLNSTYEKLQAEYGVNRWYLWQIINEEGYQPPAHICVTLGIAKYEPVPVCAVHGVVHCYDCTTQTVQRKQPRKPRVYKSLFDWPVRELRAALENREEMK